ncbi:MAG: hypothetical protein HOV94_05385 [Saccharothrix sp.]|nr:hypothetical protein [Saccharothrix sp.]
MASAGELRTALNNIRNASTPAAKTAAKSVAQTLGAQTALEIGDRTARGQFVTSYEDDINTAMGG